MPRAKKSEEPKNTPPTLNQLPDTVAKTLAPLLAKATNLELPILRTENTLLRLQLQRDKILAYKQGVLESYCLLNELDPTKTTLAPDGKTLIIK